MAMLSAAARALSGRVDGNNLRVSVAQPYGGGLGRGAQDNTKAFLMSHIYEIFKPVKLIEAFFRFHLIPCKLSQAQRGHAGLLNPGKVSFPVCTPPVLGIIGGSDGNFFAFHTTSFLLLWQAKNQNDKQFVRKTAHSSLKWWKGTAEGLRCWD